MLNIDSWFGVTSAGSLHQKDFLASGETHGLNVLISARIFCADIFKSSTTQWLEGTSAEDDAAVSQLKQMHSQALTLQLEKVLWQWNIYRSWGQKPFENDQTHSITVTVDDRGWNVTLNVTQWGKIDCFLH